MRECESCGCLNIRCTSVLEVQTITEQAQGPYFERDNQIMCICLTMVSDLNVCSNKKNANDVSPVACTVLLARSSYSHAKYHILM
jgi:hypothetical protein